MVEYKEFSKPNDIGKRKEKRLFCNQPVRTVDGNGMDEFISDFSQSGCRIITPVIFNKGDLIILDFNLDEKTTFFKNPPHFFVGKVIWVRDSEKGCSEMGISFINN